VTRLLTVSLFALLLAGCGREGGDTTVQQTTTVVEQVEAPTDDEGATAPDGSARGPTEEFTGRCTGGPRQQHPLVPEPGKPGFTDVRVIETSCEFAIQVATEFALDYGPDCFEGCVKIVENLRCRTEGPAHADVVCHAARTEVRFSIQGID
jgi:hypothetical protein